jgi:predicted nicotinamide N-methyase
LEFASVRIRGQTLSLLRPANLAGFLQDPKAWADDAGAELAPYWAHLWPSSLLLADVLLQSPIETESRWLWELGSGLGLGGIAALTAGWNVVFSDIAPRSLDLISATLLETDFPARRYGIERLDWLSPPALQLDQVIAADILYEPDSVITIFGLMQSILAPGGVAWIVDPGRQTAESFSEMLVRAGWSCLQRPLAVEVDAMGMIHGHLFEVQRPG